MKLSGSVKVLNRGVSTSLWLMYALIVFEILYMISPFAIYYYSAYAAPLRMLQQSPATSWLVVHLLPHFSYQSSSVISVMHFVSWPLIVLGALLFTVAFGQIYYSKFFSKGTVNSGLYRFIRHPQYLALAILGLGTTLYWPRFIVFIMYTAMLFLYYFLARQEERRCLEKFGESYQAYLDESGMFMPRFIEQRLPDFPSMLPQKGFKRLAGILGLFIVWIFFAMAVGAGIRNYALTKISSQYTDEQAVISVAPLTRPQIDMALSTALSDPDVEISFRSMDKKLVYIIPTQWSIAELGVQGDGDPANYFLHPETHGNSLEFNRFLLTVLITRPILLSDDVHGEDIIKQSVSFDPVLEVAVDVEHNRVVSVKKRVSRGKWDGVPVPIY
jgi:protein-S-isoprenylcysteine O-methyltransferase Ste14